MSISHKKRRVWSYSIVGIFILLVFGGILVFRSISKITEYVFEQTGMGEQLVGSIASRAQFGDKSNIAELLPRFLGFDAPRTYLVLFQNNTELRPSGGFIGVYAVLRLDKGRMDVLKLEGVEILDWETPETWKPVPPQPITDHLGVDRWYFRDSNWSPDFPTAAQKALELYEGEGGAHAAEIDTVLAITPTVFERILELTGPVTVEGKTFAAEHAVETLEYEVEYAYKDTGRTAEERKDIITPLVGAVIKRASIDGFLHPEKYLNAFQALFDEKQILAYSLDKSLHQQFQDVAWAGRMVTSTGDYLMWVDANLGALKTDHAIQRNLLYWMSPNHNYGARSAMAEMTYTHTGTFDWRTTRYLSYVRVFVPLGSRATGFEISGTKKSESLNRDTINQIDQGEENGFQWFGRFISIEPGEVARVRFYYDLPQTVGARIREENQYALRVQKQPGTQAHGLTINLSFDTTITAAEPAEVERDWGDEHYIFNTDLRVDRAFSIRL